MSSDFDNSPGLGILDQLDIVNVDGAPVDVRNLVIELTITENVYDTFVVGTVTLSAVDGILESEGLILGGQETLRIKVRSSTSFSDDTGKEEGKDIRGEFTIYAMKKTREEPNVSTVALQFVSMEAIKSNYLKISKWFAPQKRSEMVSKIYEDYLKNDKELVEVDSTTDSNFTFVCPNWSPGYAISWLRTSSTSSEDDSCKHFVFYESFNTKGDTPRTKPMLEYKFKSISKLHKQTPVMTYKLRPLNIAGRSLAEEQHRNIEILDPDPIDQFGTIQSGAYGSKLIMHDLFRKKIIENDFSYSDDWEPHNWPNKNIDFNAARSANIVNFAGNHSRTQTKVLYTNKHSFKTDEPDEGNERYKDWYQSSVSQIYTRTQNSVYLGVVGDTSRGVGQVINISKALLKPDREGVVKNTEDKYHEYGGEWLVVGCTHLFRFHAETKNYIINTYMNCKRDGMPTRMENFE